MPARRSRVRPDRPRPARLAPRVVSARRRALEFRAGGDRAAAQPAIACGWATPRSVASRLRRQGETGTDWRKDRARNELDRVVVGALGWGEAGPGRAGSP